MNGTASTKPIRTWKNLDFPHWFNWVVPLIVASILLAIGRLYQTVEKSPAEFIQNVRLLVAEKDHAGALRELNGLIALFPTNHIYLWQAAGLSSQLQKPAETAAYLERYLVSSPDPSEACPEITHSYWRAGQKDRMLDAASRCLDLEPTNSDFRFDLALANERAGKVAEALEQYQAGLTSFPGYGDFKIGHARMLLRLGRAAEAWQEISLFLEAEPGVADAELVAGLAAERTDQPEIARQIFERARTNHPDNSEIKDAYDELLRREGEK